MQEKLVSLRKFNFIMAGLHFAQAVVILLLATNFKLPLNYTYLQFNPSTQTLFQQTKLITDVPLVWLIVTFLLLSSIAHLVIATIYNKTYNQNLQKGINKARWIEYSLSASVMMIAIAMLVGIYDIGTLILIFALIAVMNLCGLIMEVHNQTTKKTNWLSYWVGCLAGIVPWIIIGLYFWGSAQNGAAPPSFVYWIFFSIFIFFDSFAVNMVLQYKKIGKWQDYLYGEKAYIILSLVAKSALAWQVFAGTLRPV